jgi:hypothetical protein
MIALSFGLWLLLAPSVWEFADGVDTGLVPITPSEAIEPTRAAIAPAGRAEGPQGPGGAPGDPQLSSPARRA